MTISKNEVEYIARLAKLDYPEEEKEKFTGQFNTILSYIEKLNELDTDTVDPLTHVVESKHVLREDIVIPSLPVEDVLRNAPAKKDSFFRVPKVIDTK